MIYAVMTTWYMGIGAMHHGQERDALTVVQFLRQLRECKVLRVPGKAIFLTRFRQRALCRSAGKSRSEIGPNSDIRQPRIHVR